MTIFDDIGDAFRDGGAVYKQFTKEGVVDKAFRDGGAVYKQFTKEGFVYEQYFPILDKITGLGKNILKNLESGFDFAKFLAQYGLYIVVAVGGLMLLNIVM